MVAPLASFPVPPNFRPSGILYLSHLVFSLGCFVLFSSFSGHFVLCLSFVLLLSSLIFRLSTLFFSLICPRFAFLCPPPFILVSSCFSLAFALLFPCFLMFACPSVLLLSVFSSFLRPPSVFCSCFCPAVVLPHCILSVCYKVTGVGRPGSYFGSCCIIWLFLAEGSIRPSICSSVHSPIRSSVNTSIRPSAPATCLTLNAAFLVFRRDSAWVCFRTTLF